MSDLPPGSGDDALDAELDTGLDTGLAAERTDIAWSRSALALVTCVAVVLRRVPNMSRATGVGLVVVVMVMLGGASLLLRRRIAAHERDPAIVLARLRLRNLALLTSFTGVLCLAVMLLTVG
jgi:uncharacterized membrane protein YidH (DUF202 family)